MWSSCHIDDEHIRRGLGLQETHARMPHRSTPRRHHRHRASGWFRRLAPRFVLSAEQLGPAWLTHWHSCWLCKRERALAVSAGDSCARVTCHAWPRGKIQSSSAILSAVQKKRIRDDLMSGPASCRNLDNGWSTAGSHLIPRQQRLPRDRRIRLARCGLNCKPSSLTGGAGTGSDPKRAWNFAYSVQRRAST